jgi:hypothetical protein
MARVSFRIFGILKALLPDDIVVSLIWDLVPAFEESSFH